MPTLTRAGSARDGGLVDYTPDVLLINEDDAAYKRVRQAYLDIFHPRNQEEFDAVTHYVSARWRLLRCAELETLMLNTSLREIKPEVESDPRGATVAAEAHTLIAYERCLGSTELFRRLPRIEANLRRNLKDAESHLRRLLKGRATAESPETTPIATPPTPASEGKVKYINEPNVRRVPRQSFSEGGSLGERGNRTLDLGLPAGLPAEVLAKAGALPKVGRNRRCPCGSGLKFKRCCIGKPPSEIPKAA